MNGDRKEKVRLFDIDIDNLNLETATRELMKAATEGRKAIVVTGRLNRLMMLMPRFLSRHRLIKVLAVMGDPERAL